MERESKQNAGKEVLNPQEGYVLAVERLVITVGCHIKYIGESVKLFKSDVILENNTVQPMNIEIDVFKKEDEFESGIKIELKTTIKKTVFALSKLLRTQEDYEHLEDLIRWFEKIVRFTQRETIITRKKVQQK